MSECERKRAFEKREGKSEAKEKESKRETKWNKQLRLLNVFGIYELNDMLCLAK